VNGINTSREIGNEQAFLVAYCLDNEIPIMPTPGLWSVKAWAKFLCQSEDAVRDWVKLYSIPHKGTQRKLFIETEHMREYLPEDVLFETEEEPKVAKKAKSTRKR